MFLSSLGIRGIYFKSVYSFPGQYRPSFGNQRILNFRVMAERDIKLQVLEKCLFNCLFVQCC